MWKRFNLFSDNQFWFRQKHSTTLAITHLYNRFLQYKDYDDGACEIFLGITKAFESVDHDLLIDELEHNGVRRDANKLLKSYLQIKNNMFL